MTNWSYSKLSNVIYPKIANKCVFKNQRNLFPAPTHEKSLALDQTLYNVDDHNSVNEGTQ
jgi:hypothetical protein